MRKRWTREDLEAACAALPHMRVDALAPAFKASPRALRAALRRHGLSIREIREAAEREKPTISEIVVRRPVGGPPATYGAKALAKLPDRACRWPIGDPAKRGFRFCGKKRSRHPSYCAHHAAVAREPECPDANPPAPLPLRPTRCCNA